MPLFVSASTAAAGGFSGVSTPELTTLKYTVSFGIFVHFHDSHCKFYWTLSPIFTFVTDKLRLVLHRVSQGALSRVFTLDHSRSMGPQGRWLGSLSISRTCCDISENIMTGLSAPSGYTHFLGQMVSHCLFMKPTAVAWFLSAVTITGLSAIPGAEMCSKTVVYQQLDGFNCITVDANKIRLFSFH